MTNGPKVDRRVRRTQKALQDALSRLMIEHNYDDLTVAEICMAADVGRSAFYVHYGGKDALLRAAFAALKADLLADGEVTITGLCARFLAHASRHRQLYRAMNHSQARTITATAVRTILEEHVLTEMNQISPSGVSSALHAQVFVDLLLSVTYWWFDREPQRPVAEIERMFTELAAGMLRAQ